MAGPSPCVGEMELVLATQPLTDAACVPPMQYCLHPQLKPFVSRGNLSFQMQSCNSYITQPLGWWGLVGGQEPPACGPLPAHSEAF